MTPVLVSVALGLAAFTSSGVPVCEEESPIALPEPAPAEALLPCAMVESGVLGPSCQDVAFYVVTDAGVLLCAVDLDTFALSSASTEVVERAPAVPGAAPSGTGAWVAVAAAAFSLSPRCGRSLPLSPPAAQAVLLDRSEAPPVPPS